MICNRSPVVVIFRGAHGALAVARTLGRLGISAYLVAQEGMSSPVLSSRYWKGTRQWDFAAPAQDSLAFLARFGRELHERHGQRPLLLTLSDWVAIFIEEHADRLGEIFTFPRTPAPVIRKLADKWQTFQLAKNFGIPVPETVFPSCRAEVEAYIRTARFPLVMKPADPYLAYVPTKVIVRSPEEALDKFERDAALGPANLVLQEYIPGDVSNVWMCNAYFDRLSTCRAIFTGRKLRQVSDMGIASLAVCLPNETVAEQTRSLLQAAGYSGCVGVGWRYDPRDGYYKLLDVNPRVSGVFRLFRATNGLDVVRICYLDLTEQPIQASKLAAGRKWLLEDDIPSSIRAIRHGKFTLDQWLRSLLGVRESHWFAVDDPLPGFRWLWNSLQSRYKHRPRMATRTTVQSTPLIAKEPAP